MRCPKSLTAEADVRSAKAAHDFNFVYRASFRPVHKACCDWTAGAILEACDPVGRDRLSISCFLRDEAGAGAIEYGLLACIVALVVVFAAAKGMSPQLLLTIAQALAGDQGVLPPSAGE